jgi:hypothetical protein
MSESTAKPIVNAISGVMGIIIVFSIIVGFI